MCCVIIIIIIYFLPADSPTAFRVNLELSRSVREDVVAAEDRRVGEESKDGKNPPKSLRNAKNFQPRCYRALDRHSLCR